VGLTGGIASGKSAVAEVLKSEKIPVVDADEVSRAVMRPGSSLFHDIVQAFGPEVLNQDGDLDRVALGEKVFSNPQALERLNALTHPVIWAEMQRQVTELEQKHPLVVVMVPLLLENRRQDWVDEVWVVSLPREVQKARLMERNHLSPEQAEARISAQMPLEEKLTLADRVIDNSGTLEQLHQSLLEVLSQAQHTL